MKRPVAEWRKDLVKPAKRKRRRPNIEHEAGVVVDGIKWLISKVTGEWLEFCVTLESKAARREQIWLRCQGRCEGCGHDMHPDHWEWHHRVHRSHGGDDSMQNAQALCKYPERPGGGISCHGLVHRPELDEQGKMKSRLGDS